MSSRNKGFTLIELLVVLAIVGILVSVVVASLNNNKKSHTSTYSMTTTANAQEKLPDGVTKFTDGSTTCYVLDKQHGGLSNSSWNYFGGISYVNNS